MNKLILASSLTLSVAFISCGGGNKEENHDLTDSTAIETVKDTTPVTVNEETKFKFDFAMANIPAPVGSINELSSWGVPYNVTLLADAKKQLSTSSEFTKSLALGIYNIDMSYAMVNNKGEDVLTYMKTVVKLADNLGLKSAIDNMLGKRAEMNLSNKDSLLAILDQMYTKSDSYLRTNERVYTATTLFAGSWIEGLYLTCKIGESVTDAAAKEKAYKHLWDQRFYLKNLTEILNDFKDKKECDKLNSELKAIHADIDAIKDPKNMKDDNFKAIASKIYALRASILK
jgi:hypothetical protein